MGSDSLSSAISGLSEQERLQLHMETDKITGLSAKRAEEERRKERLRKMVNKLPKIKPHRSSGGSAGGRKDPEQSMADALEQASPSEVSNYWVEIRQALDDYRSKNLIPAAMSEPVASLEGMYEHIVELKIKVDGARSVVNTYKAEFGPAETEWFDQLKEAEPARASEYINARRSIQDNLKKVRMSSKAVAETQKELEDQVQSLAAEEDKLMARLAQALRPLSRNKRSEVERQVRQKVKPLAPDKRVALLTQIVTQLERYNNKK